MTEWAPPLPDLDDCFAVSDEDAARFRRDGHILLRRVASPEEVAAYRPSILAVRDRHGQEVTPLEERDTYGRAFLKGMNLWVHDAEVARFVLSRRFARLAADLLGVNGVRIYHDQALVKESGGGLTPWHQDQHFWPLDTDATVTMWMPLVDVTPDMGTMRFATGSHRNGCYGDLPISDEPESRFDEFVRRHGFRVAPPAAMAAGDATFHYGWTLHGAPPNLSPQPREVMTIIWFADGARVTPPDNSDRGRDLERWLPGCRPGDPAAGKLNPLAYRR